jgi:hypothetical protein
LNLKDNFGKLNLGSSTCDQSAILGDNFLRWFDKFLSTLVLNGHLGNLASPLVPTPEMLDVYREYFDLKTPKFLSGHVKIVDNNYVVKQERIAVGQIGDAWKSTVKSNSSINNDNVNFSPKDGLSTDNPTPSTGELTVAPDGSNVNNIATDPGPINPSTNPDAITIIETMKAKGYKIFTRPYEMNIVGIRRAYEGMNYTNSFSDSMYLIYKVDNSDKWELKKYPCSTMPGYYKKSEGGKTIDVKQSKTMQDRGGMGILKPAQYIDVYAMGNHCDAPAMITLGPQKAYRDKTTGPVIKYTADVEGYFGMFIHRGYPGGGIVNNWSEGCQIFGNANDLNDFFKWCGKHKEKYGNKFSYTLIEERSLRKVETTNTATANNIVDRAAGVLGLGR